MNTSAADRRKYNYLFLSFLSYCWQYLTRQRNFITELTTSDDAVWRYLTAQTIKNHNMQKTPNQGTQYTYPPNSIFSSSNLTYIFCDFWKNNTIQVPLQTCKVCCGTKVPNLPKYSDLILRNIISESAKCPICLSIVTSYLEILSVKVWNI